METSELSKSEMSKSEINKSEKIQSEKAQYSILTGAVPAGFVGRDEIMDKITRAIDDGEKALVLKGPAGVGKSAILGRLAQKLRAQDYSVLLIRGLTSGAVPIWAATSCLASPK